MKREFYFPSKDGITNIHAAEWIPEGQVTSVLQIVHGMVEHIERYDNFGNFLASRGIYVTGHSHLGHGKSVIGQEKWGYFADPDGNECVIGDIHELRCLTQKKYPDLPYFMLGHSMGSFLLRQYLGRYAAGLAGAMILGTGDQPDLVLKAGKAACKLVAAVKGWEYRSSFVNSFAVGAFEKKLGGGWICTDEEVVKAYQADPMCSFVFTLNAFYHMFDGMAKMNAQEKAGKIPKDLPILFAAGSEDLVGSCGKSVKAVCERYRNSGIKDVKLKLYEGDRHEILNEKDKEVVYEDLCRWIIEKI